MLFAFEADVTILVKPQNAQNPQKETVGALFEFSVLFVVQKNAFE